MTIDRFLGFANANLNCTKVRSRLFFRMLWDLSAQSRGWLFDFQCSYVPDFGNRCAIGRDQTEISSQLNASLIIAVISMLFLTRHLGIAMHERDEAQVTLILPCSIYPISFVFAPTISSLYRPEAV